MSRALSIWVVMDRPLDYPTKYIARRWEVRGAEDTLTPDLLQADTLDGLRDMLPPGLCRMPRFPEDEPQIVEVWL